MKSIPWIIAGLAFVSLSANAYLLIQPQLVKSCFLYVNIWTGCSLLTILLLFFLSKKRLKKRQQEHIDKFFSKN